MLAVVSWWLIVQVLALAVLPLTWRLFSRLPGRGYPFAKALGLLLVSYLLWLGAIFHLVPNEVGGIVFSLALVGIVSWSISRSAWQRDGSGQRPLLVWLAEHRALVITTEMLFALVLVAWAVFRAYNPDISGTEKPMEFAFINGVLRSRLFPPQDPWLSGYGISYYYFGYVMLAALIRLSGVDPAVGFNLGVALWYSLVMVGAFGVVHALVAVARGEGARAAGVVTGAHRRLGSIGWGLLGALFVGFAGNLEGLIDSAYQRDLLPSGVANWLNIEGLTRNPPTGDWTGGFWWWWRASRVINDLTLPLNGQREHVEVIDEFPFFSFLLGDMHPHVLALPFVLLVIALALNVILWRRTPVRVGSPDPVLPGVESGQAREQSSPDAAPVVSPEAVGIAAPVAATQRASLGVRSFWAFLGDVTGMGSTGVIVYAVALGGLAFLNTWDFPIYLALVTLALGVSLSLQDGLNGRTVGRAALGGIALAALGWLAYLPFYVGFQSQLGGILPNLLFPSRFVQYFIMFGPFLVIAVLFLLGLTAGALARSRDECESQPSSRSILGGFALALPWTLLLPVLALALIVLAFALLPSGQAMVQDILNNPAVQANVPEATVRGLVSLVLRVRGGDPWTYLVLALLIAWATGIVWAFLRSRGAEAAPQVSLVPRVPADLLAVLMIGLALILTLVPEFFYLRDLFGSRMNTVFKFYYQAWAMLALASAYGLSRLAERGTRAALRIPAVILAVVMAFGMLWYPLAAIPSKADNFQGHPTLDGLNYMRLYSLADLAAIQWLAANVAPDAVVLEASGGSYSAEGAGRVSMATGNPTLLGWDFHERQWRGKAYDELVAGRPEALEAIYRTAPPEQLPALLDQWGVDYVYVGALERNKYKVSDATLPRFDRALKLVYDKDGVRIYAR
jgi:uncharacterized membrane protein